MPNWEYFKESVVGEAQRQVARVAEAFGLAGYGMTGGYFCCKIVGSDGLLVEPTLIGTVTNGQDEKYKELCAEKAERLEDEYFKNNYLSSWESRDETAEQWGGAVVGNDVHDDNLPRWSFRCSLARQRVYSGL
jgi:hypothetical protein